MAVKSETLRRDRMAGGCDRALLNILLAKGDRQYLLTSFLFTFT
ncbi:MAG: hypothetical protein WCD53_07555 [Microcoleus sp.]